MILSQLIVESRPTALQQMQRVTGWSLRSNGSILSRAFSAVPFLPCANTLQSCPTLCNPIVCSLLGSSIHEIFQAKMLKRVAISFSRGTS